MSDVSEAVARGELTDYIEAEVRYEDLFPTTGEAAEESLSDRRDDNGPAPEDLEVDTNGLPD